MADISTPIITPRVASRRRTGASGIAARRIAVHASARTSIDAHISASATSTQTGVAATSESKVCCGADPLQRHVAQAERRRRRAPTTAALRATRTSGRGRGFSSGAARLDRLELLRGDRRQAVGGLQAGAQREPLARALGLLGAAASSIASS